MNRPLLDDRSLEWSETVANCLMNRERELTGTNSYTADLGLNPLEFLQQRLEQQQRVSWLDLCCGTGRALLQAGEYVASCGDAGRVTIHGVDLVEMFAPRPGSLPHVSLEVASLHQWQPSQSYELVTCVHGLHYIGDKLGLVARAASWLEPAGVLLAHLDLGNLGRTDVEWTAAAIEQELHQQGLEYDTQRRLVSCHGHRTVTFSCEYAGADDRAGPNFTGQPAVTSWYAPRVGD